MEKGRKQFNPKTKQYEVIKPQNRFSRVVKEYGLSWALYMIALLSFASIGMVMTIIWIIRFIGGLL